MKATCYKPRYMSVKQGMADLFSVTAPLRIKSPHGGEKVIAEIFQHPYGIVFFEIFWNQLVEYQGIHFIQGDIKGEGPWKVGGYVLSVLACHGTDATLAADYADWQMYLQTPVNNYPDMRKIENIFEAFIVNIKT